MSKLNFMYSIVEYANKTLSIKLFMDRLNILRKTYKMSVEPQVIKYEDFINDKMGGLESYLGEKSKQK